MARTYTLPYPQTNWCVCVLLVAGESFVLKLCTSWLVLPHPQTNWCVRADTEVHIQGRRVEVCDSIYCCAAAVYGMSRTGPEG